MTCLGGLYTAAMFMYIILDGYAGGLYVPLLVLLSCVMFDVLSNDYCRASMCRFIWMQGVIDGIIGYFYVASRSEVSF